MVAGRWLSADPYAGSYDLTNPQSMNRYAYVLSNPLGFTDPWGLDVCNDSEDYTNGQDITYDCVSADDGGDGGGGGGVGGSSGSSIPGYGQIGGGPADGGGGGATGNAPNNGSSYSFVKSWWKDVKNCVGNVALPTIANNLNPLSIGIGTGADIASQMSEASLAGAASWSVSRGLTVPLRSSIVRADVASAETLGEVSGGLTMASVAYALGDAVVAECNQCQ